MTGNKHKGDGWFVSHYNYLQEVWNILPKIDIPKRVLIHDVTLRDGEQQAGIVFRKEDKIKIAQALAEAKVDRIEAGMPTVSEEDFLAVKEIASMRLGPKVFAFARCMTYDAELARKADVDGVVMEIPSSDHLIELGYGWTVEKAVKLATEATRYAHEHGLQVVFFTIDATRANLDVFTKIIKAVETEGHMDSLTLADTFGVMNPLAMYYLIKQIKQVIHKPIEIHAHNDFGMAVANSIFAVLAGAEVIHTSVNGIGERTGNTPLEEVVMAMKYLFGISTNVNTTKLRKLSKIVAELSGVRPPPQKPVVGDGIFTVESGILVGWWSRLEGQGLVTEMFPYRPEIVGHDPVKIVYGKKSGVDSVLYKAKKINININENIAKEILLQIKSLALQKKSLVDEKYVEDLLLKYKTT
jgi:isopropylmalate/homocitrate/citramalate synthase